jgi:hypothetical protein
MINNKWLKKNYGYLILLGLAFILLVFSFFAPAIFVQAAISKDLDFTQTGTIGDTIGGIMNPFIAIAAAILTFLAFFIQYRANQDIRNQFKIQKFESQFYEMLRLHKENVNEMKITGYGISKEKTKNYSKTKKGKKKSFSFSETTSQTVRYVEGRKVFVTMFTELIACYELIENYASLHNCENDDLLKLAYRIFFFGANSDLIFSNDLKIPKELIKTIKSELKIVRNKHKSSIGEVNRYSGIEDKIIELYIKYKPFSGHSSKLGHYYRHLYGTVKFVVQQEGDLLNYDEVRGYLKILRSQMSNDEQLMLYYNCIIGFGKDWEDKGFLTKYRMIHNLPINRAKYVDKPRERFNDFIKSIKNDEDPLFEWGDYEKEE